jgi:hypothetical protein
MTEIRNKCFGHSELEFGYCLGFGAWTLVLCSTELTFYCRFAHNFIHEGLKSPHHI